MKIRSVQRRRASDFYSLLENPTFKFNKFVVNLELQQTYKLFYSPFLKVRIRRKSAKHFMQKR